MDAALRQPAHEPEGAGHRAESCPSGRWRTWRSAGCGASPTTSSSKHADEAQKAGLLEPSDLAPRAFEVLVDIDATDIGEMSADLVTDLLPIAHKLAETRALNPRIDAPRLSHERLLVRLLHEIRDAWGRFFEQLMDDACIRFAYMAQDFARAVISGIVHDVLPHLGFAHLDDIEFKDWLQSHGASNFTLQHAPWIKGYYDLTFAFEHGDTSKPNLAAGTAMKDMLRIGFNYKGAVMWKMQAGMGDVVFSPLYQVLRARCINVRVLPAGTQPRALPGQDRCREDPLPPAGEVEAGWWLRPIRRRNRRLVVLAERAELGPDRGRAADQADAGRPRDHPRERRTRERALRPVQTRPPADALVRGTDFDYVILATSVESVKQICTELYQDDANLPFRRMLDNSNSVITQAVQLWCNKSLADLGWPEGLKKTHKPCIWGPEWKTLWELDPITSAYVEPLDTYSDMTHLIQREYWKDGLVKSIAYFCGPMLESKGATSKAAKQFARTKAIELITNYLQVFWPKPSPTATSTGMSWSTKVERPPRPASTRSTGVRTRPAASATLRPSPAPSNTASSPTSRATTTCCSPATGPRRRSTAAASRRP